MYKLYGIPNCDSVKKARLFLNNKNLDYEFVNYKTNPVSKALLSDWMKQKSWEEILNKKGTTFRALTADEKVSITDASTAQKIILANNSLIKRPVVTKDGQIVAIGFDEVYYHTIF